MLDILWTILYFIFIFTGFLTSRSSKWSIKAKIFLLVLQLCLCSLLAVIGFCSNQWLFTNLACILVFLGLLKILKYQLKNLEKEAAEKALEAQKKHNNKSNIIDAEGYTICN